MKYGRYDIDKMNPGSLLVRRLRRMGVITDTPPVVEEKSEPVAKKSKKKAPKAPKKM